MEKITYKQALINKILEKAIKRRDLRAIQLIFEYTEGKPRATLDLNTDVALPVPIFGGTTH